MKFARSGAAVSLLAAGTLVLTACGGGTNSSSSGAGGTSGSVHCGGKKELHSSGSTAQENAMEQFVYAYVRSCPGYTLDYNANGSGAGVTQFLKTIAGAKIMGQGNDLVLDTSSFYRPTQPGSYPIVLATYEIVCSKYPDATTGTAVRAFMQAAIGPGQEGLDQYGSIPLPKSFQAKLAAAVNAIS